MDAKRQTFVRLMRENFGSITKCCEIMGITRQTFYNWKDNDPEFKQAIEGIDDYLLDFVENALYKLIRKGDKAATIFYMKTKGKHLGYVERQEIKQVDAPTFVMYDARKKDNDESKEGK